jgi:membrane protein YdbS with pleckstrin-like domain
MAKYLHIFVDGEKEGPYTLKEVAAMLEDDVISFNDYGRFVGEARRVRLDTLFEEIPDGEDEEDSEEVESVEEDVDDEVVVENDEEEEYEEEVEEEPQASVAAVAQSGSHLIYCGHPSFLKYPFAWIICIGCAIAGYLLGPTSLVYFMAGCVIAVLAFTYIVIDRTTRKYIVMSRRVELEWGLLVKSSNEVRIADIRTINVKKSGFKGILGIGDVEFSSAGDNIDVAFTDVWAAHKVKKLVRSIQDADEEDE